MKKKYLTPTTKVHFCNLSAYMHQVSVNEYKSGGKKTYGGDAYESTDSNQGLLNP